ncbi:MAG: lipopolysaccharide biosynthesis protein [Planctomycetes bacterium]|nr:lipopolysaccharide biosynthesis protein [Planctomycetota bacterium]
MIEKDQAVTDSERAQFKRSATLGAVQSMFARYYSMAVGMAYAIIMARILSPEDFGLMALAVFFLTFSTRLREFSLNEVLIQKQVSEDELCSTHWTMQLALGGLQVALVLVALPILSRYYPEARVRNATLTGILTVLLAGDIITIATSTPFTILRKTMRFRHLAILEAAGATIGAASGATLAFAGFGIWGLVVGRTAPTLLRFAYCWALHPWKLSFRFNRRIAVSFLKFGVYLWLIQTTIFITYSTGDFLVGSMIGLAALGMYSKAFHLAVLPVEMLTGMLATVTYPVYCRLQNNREDVRKALARVLSIIFRLTVPIALGMVLVGSEFIEIVLGDKWLPAAPLLKVMAFYTVLRSVFDDTGRVFLALGKPQIPAVLRVVQSVFQIGVCYLLVAHFGAMGASLSTDLAVLIGLALNYFFLHRLIRIPFKQIFLQPALCGVVTLLCVTAFARALGPVNVYAAFFIKGTLCVAVYFGLLFAFARRELIGEFMMLKSAMSSRAKTAGETE